MKPRNLFFSTVSAVLVISIFSIHALHSQNQQAILKQPPTLVWLGLEVNGKYHQQPLCIKSLADSRINLLGIQKCRYVSSWFRYDIETGKYEECYISPVRCEVREAPKLVVQTAASNKESLKQMFKELWHSSTE